MTTRAEETSSEAASERRRLLRSALAGLGLGLAVFAAESWLIQQSGSIGLHLETEGPYAALFAAVRPALPRLLLKIAAVYAAAGAVLGACAGLLVSALGISGRWTARLAFLVELAALGFLLTWTKAIARPALFDDLPAWRPALAWCVDKGSPWHPLAAAAAWVGLHIAAGVRLRRWRPLGMLGWPALGLVVLGLVPRMHGPARAPARPLIVLFGIDAFRPDRLQALGSSRLVAPNLERFLEDATLFTRAYSPIAQTEPAWRSLLTARWPHRTGVRHALTAEAQRLPAPTFAAQLTWAGYQSRFQTDCSRFNFQDADSGFAERVQPPRGAVNFLLEKLRYRAVGVVADNALGSWWLPELVDNRGLAGLYDPIGYAERMASAWVSEAKEGPALLAFHSASAHFPGDPVYPFHRRFVGADQPMERRLRMHFSPIVQGGVQGGWSREGSEALYDELLAQADAQLGVVLNALKAQGLYDDATIVVFSDHGESFHQDMPALAGATPVHGARLSEEENRILLALKLPMVGGRRATVERVDALVRLIDIGPTVLELAEQKPLEGADGVSLLPLVRGEEMAPLRLYAETAFTHASPDVFDPEHLQAAPRTFEAYRVRPDGIVEMAPAAHDAHLREKDIGAFDGQRWIIRSPRRDGSVRQSCRGACEAPELAAWLEQVSRQP